MVVVVIVAMVVQSGESVTETDGRCSHAYT